MVSIRLKLLFALIMNIMLIGALGFFAIKQADQMNEAATFVTARMLPARETSDRINALITRYRSLQLEYLVNTSAADRTRVTRMLVEVEGQMGAALQQYNGLIKQEQERTILNGIQQIWSDFVRMTNDEFLPRSELNGAGSVNPYLSKTAMVYQKLTQQSQQLVAQIEQQVAGAVSQVETTHDQANQFLLIMLAGTLGLSVLISVSLAGTLARNIGKLKRATTAITAGDLEQQVGIRSRDELGTLARHFNEMVSSLAVQRRLVEVRNAELQQSLEAQQQLAGELEASRIVAEKANRFKSWFLVSMRYELQSTSDQIGEFSRLLGDARFGTLSDFQRELQQKIMASAGHLNEMMSRMIDLSTMEMGRMELRFETADVQELIQSVMPAALGLATEKRLGLTIDVPEGLPALWVDPARAREVLLNLLSNAAKFTARGGITIRARQHAADALVIAVEDTGMGMDAEKQRLIFQELPDESHAKDTYTASGLGLLICKRLVALHGGRIWVESKPHQGSTFCFTMPLAEVAQLRVAVKPELAHQPLPETALEVGQAAPTLKLPWPATSVS